MVCKEFIFHVQVPYQLLQTIRRMYLSIDKLSTKHCNSKKFCILQNILWNVLLFLTNLSFLYCQKCFILTKSLNTSCASNEMK